MNPKTESFAWASGGLGLLRELLGGFELCVYDPEGPLPHTALFTFIWVVYG